MLKKDETSGKRNQRLKSQGLVIPGTLVKEASEVEDEQNILKDLSDRFSNIENLNLVGLLFGPENEPMENQKLSGPEKSEVARFTILT